MSYLRKGNAVTEAHKSEDPMVTELPAPFTLIEPVHEFCNVCGWRKGGIDSWDGKRCKCRRGHNTGPVVYYRKKRG